MLEDIPQLHEEIAELFSDLLEPLLLKLPPRCEVLYEISLIDESKQLKHRLPNCSEAFWPELAVISRTSIYMHPPMMTGLALKGQD